MYRSIKTIKADAALKTFGATGEDIVWAVLDTGIDGQHPHFQKHNNLRLTETLQHISLVEGDDEPLTDPDGHGTHVAGIIAGETDTANPNPSSKVDALVAVVIEGTGEGRKTTQIQDADTIRGVAPECKLLSIKTLDKNRRGKESAIISALEYVDRLNDYGRKIRVHGVNISAGYRFDPKAHAAGHSPICKAAIQLVRSGVVVVVSAGNDGYGVVTVNARKRDASHAGTINDPGNAADVITVGSTHRSEPHRYGTSFFSSKGPTADGRTKPDILAPGERIISATTTQNTGELEDGTRAVFAADSGTSMAAPHVSGAAASLLSVHREFIGDSRRIKEILTSSATDLERDRNHQGAGLVDLMRAIQSI